MPSWRGLIHFDQVVSVDFTDATKLEHIVKVSMTIQVIILLLISLISDFAFCEPQSIQSKVPGRRPNPHLLPSCVPELIHVYWLSITYDGDN